MVEGKAMLTGPRSTINRARSLRRSMSYPEILLWTILRQRPNGWKFRRQHPAGPYILDFFCADACLAIEIDGAAHDDATRVQSDAVKNAWLHSQGMRLIRIPAGDVLADASAVADAIVRVCDAVPLHHAAHGPPPRPLAEEEQV
jgi:very-short-patch-repair endonuclease